MVMPTLQQIERDAQLEVPKEIGGNLKMLFADPNYQLSVRFIVDQLCGQRRLSFVPGLTEGRDMMLWREGRRFVGEWLVRIVETPIPEEATAESPARTMSERARRRNKTQPPQG